MKTKTISTRAALIAAGVIKENLAPVVAKDSATHKASADAAIAARRHELARDVPVANSTHRGGRK